MEPLGIVYRVLGRTTTEMGKTNGYVVEMAYGGIQSISITEMVAIVARGDIPMVRMSFESGKPTFYVNTQLLDSILPEDNKHSNIASQKELYGYSLYGIAQEVALRSCRKLYAALNLSREDLIDMNKNHTKTYIQRFSDDMLDTLSVFQELIFPYVVHYGTISIDIEPGKSVLTDNSLFNRLTIKVIDMQSKFESIIKIGWQLKVEDKQIKEEQAKIQFMGMPGVPQYTTPLLPNKHLAIQDLNKALTRTV